MHSTGRLPLCAWATPGLVTGAVATQLLMQRLASCKDIVGLLALGLLCACGDDDTQDTRAARDGGADAAGKTDVGSAMDASSADTGGPLMTRLQAVVDQYDRRIRAVCACQVASGNYKTEKECLDLGLSGPDWAQCATKALADHDSPATRAGTQCLTEFLEQAADCTEAAKCDTDKLAQCGTPSSECLAKANMGITLILAACPDFGLLSRLPTTPENDRDD